MIGFIKGIVDLAIGNTANNNKKVVTAKFLKLIFFMINDVLKLLN